jgi:hypothetical protein
MLPRQRKKSMVVTQESFEQFLGNPSFNLLWLVGENSE